MGIVQTQLMDNDATPTNADYNATFNPYPATPAAIDLSTGTPNVAVLTAGAATDIGQGGGTVAVFGLGTQCNMIGSVMTDAPVHFPEGGDQPEDVYLRYVICVRLDDGAGGTLEKGKFVGVFAVEPDSGELTDVGAHLAEYYENRGS